MSTATKWVVGIAILAILAWLLWWSGWLAKPAQAPTQQQSAASAQAPNNGMSAPSDTSDAALSQDGAAVDAQMQALQGDSANVDTSLNDQPIEQAY